MRDSLEAIDIHAHFFGPESWTLLAASNRHGVEIEETLDGTIVRVEGNAYGPLPSALTDGEAQVAALGDRGVVHAVVSPPPFLFCYSCDPALTEEFSIAQNEAIANLVRDGKGAFSGLATVPLQRPERAATIMARAIDELGLIGVEIGTHVAGKDLDDPSFEPFWQRAAELNALVFIHPSDVRGVAFDAPYYLRNLVGNPLETSYALSRIIFGGVLERYGNLKVLASHAGGFLPYTIGRLDRGYMCRRECQSALTDSPSVYLRRLYFDSISHAAPSLRYLVELVGADHVALGSDFPFDMGDSTPLDSLAGLTRSASAQIAFQTARRLIARDR